MNACPGPCIGCLLATPAPLLIGKGGTGLKNGDLIRHAEAEFELFITADQNIRYQQNLASRRIAILELSTNKLDRIELAADLILATVAEIKPAEFRRLLIP